MHWSNFLLLGCLLAVLGTLLYSIVSSGKNKVERRTTTVGRREKSNDE